MKINRFEDIEAWQAARELTRQIYKAAACEKFARDYGLRDQVQRAAVSIMANVVHPVKYMRWTISRGKGFDSQSNKGFIQFLGYALRSATEVQSHLYVALDQGYVSRDEFDRLYTQAIKVKNLIHGFMRYLRNAERRT